MDQIDAALLNLIQADGRCAYARLGAKVGLSAPAVHGRIKKLQEEGIIKRWTALLEADAVGLSVLSYVHVLLDLPVHREAFCDAVSDLPAVQECHLVSGAWTYLLKLRTPSIKSAETLINTRIAVLPGVARLQTEIVTESIKESTILAADPANFAE